MCLCPCLTVLPQLPLILTEFASARELATFRESLMPTLDENIKSALKPIFTKRKFAVLRKLDAGLDERDWQAGPPCCVGDIQYADWVPEAIREVSTVWTKRFLRLVDSPAINGVGVIGLHLAEAALADADPSHAIQDPHCAYDKSVLTGIIRFSNIRSFLVCH